MTKTKNLGVATWILMAAATLPLSLNTNVAAQTVWRGATVTINHTSTSQKDQLTSDCWLTRGGSHPLFNAAAPYTESSYDGTDSPKNTEWAAGTLADYDNGTLTFDTWANTIGGGGTYGFDGLATFLASNPNYVMHIVSDNIYVGVTFISWSPGGNYSYSRTTPSVVIPPTPTVTLTNPPAGLTLAAPATVHLGATATVSSGTITNVSFFASSGGAPTLIGTALTSPFTVNSTSLAAGTYSLTAVATAAGVSGTSAPVNLTVVTPVAVSNSVPAISNQHFTFSFTANSGLTYIVQRSTNLATWTPVFTNVASSGTVPFTDSAILGNAGYYRIVRQSNP